MKTDQAKYKTYKKGEKSRKWAAKRKKNANDPNVQEVASDSASSTLCSAFWCKQALHRSLSRADLHLSKSPNKKAEIDSFVLKFEKKLTFSLFYDFLKRHKEYVYNTKIPHSSCSCEI